MSEDFSADLEHEHRLIDAGIEAYLDSGQRPAAERRADLMCALDTLRRHIYFEEEYLFPPLRALGLVGPIAVMVREHGAMWTAITALADAIDDPPETNAAHCHDLLRLLAAHNGKEEGIVYAEARRLLPAADQAELSVAVRTAELPSGWTSQATGVR